MTYAFIMTYAYNFLALVRCLYQALDFAGLAAFIQLDFHVTPNYWLMIVVASYTRVRKKYA
jgi:hypothetical protein